jgi:hypothetical protein
MNSIRVLPADRSLASPKLFRLQLHQNPSYTSHVPSNGRRRRRSALECRRFGSPLGILRTAEGGKSGVAAYDKRTEGSH